MHIFDWTISSPPATLSMIMGICSVDKGQILAHSDTQALVQEVLVVSVSWNLVFKLLLLHSRQNKEVHARELAGVLDVELDQETPAEAVPEGSYGGGYGQDKKFELCEVVFDLMQLSALVCYALCAVYFQLSLRCRNNANLLNVARKQSRETSRKKRTRALIRTRTGCDTLERYRETDGHRTRFCSRSESTMKTRSRGLESVERRVWLPSRRDPILDRRVSGVRSMML